MAKEKSIKLIFRDPEFWAILAFNLFILYAYYIGTTSVQTVIVLYFLQSTLIGVQTFIRMMGMGFKQPPKTSFSNRFGTAFFFAFHYGFFHLVYFIFIIAIVGGMKGGLDFTLIASATLFMFISMVLSLVSDIKRDMSVGAKPMGIMFQPYFRILPMHIFIIVGFNTEEESITSAFVIFIALKTVADLLMHIVVNQTFARRRPKAIEGWI